MVGTRQELCEFWDTDAATYDRSASHHPSTALARAAWTAALARLLPSPPARVLDVGAGTGLLSLIAARLGHRVAALDFSPEMLERLRVKATVETLEVETVEGPAEEPPAEAFGAVVERHVVWTLPDPVTALKAWRQAAPNGRLLLFESSWGTASGPAEALRHRGQDVLRRLRAEPPVYHGDYPPSSTTLPFRSGLPADRLVELVEASGWGVVRVERLRDVEWTMAQSLPQLDRALGVTPRYVVIAGS